MCIIFQDLISVKHLHHAPAIKKEKFKEQYQSWYNGFWSTYFVKCFSAGIDSQYIKDISQFYVGFNSEFRYVLNKVSDTVLFFFQPNQFLRPREEPEEPKFIWRKSDNFSNAEMFQITSLELLKRRDKHNDKCLTKWNEYDNLVLKHFLSSVGCRPPYINDDETNFCNTKQKLQQARYNGWSYAKKSKVLNPCQELSLINYKHDFYPSEHEAKDLYLLSVSYPPIIKLIKQSQAVDPHSLIGNIGGYIGLFLGSSKSDNDNSNIDPVEGSKIFNKDLYRFIFFSVMM